MNVVGGSQRQSIICGNLPHPRQQPSIVRPVVKLGQCVTATSKNFAISVQHLCTGVFCKRQELFEKDAGDQPFGMFGEVVEV
jgi:hypothetical protein